MKKELYLTVILFALLASCEKKGQVDQQKINPKLTESQLPNASAAATKIDTIFKANTPSRIVRKIRQDKNGNLLITAFDNVIIYNGESFSAIPKPEDIESFDAYDALTDSKGNIWIASTHYGVFRYDGKDFMHFTTDDGLAHIRTMDIHEDRAGNIWIATMGGISFYNGNTFRNLSTKDGLTHNDVSTIMEDSTGKIWFGTRGTACLYNPATNEFTEIIDANGRTFYNIWSIIEDGKNNIWIGGEKGLWRYDGTLFTTYSSEFVNSIYEDREGAIWTTSPQGSVKRFDNKSLSNENTFIEIYKSNSMPFRVAGDHEGNIWIGTGNGIFRYKENTIDYFINSKQ